MPTVIGCMIVQNSVELLDLSLGSLMPMVDSAVVVDGGSQDGTPDIAATMGATVIRAPWPGSNSLQRQVYLDHLIERFPREEIWALVLDSDEVIVGSDPRNVARDLSSSGLEFGMLPRRWLVCTAAGLEYVSSQPHYPDPQMRLFRVRPGLRYGGIVHEVLYGIGRGREVPAPHLLHLDFLLNDGKRRTDKSRRYERAEAGSGVPRFYRFERYGFRLSSVPEAEADSSLSERLMNVTRVCIEAPNRRWKAIQHLLTWRILEGFQPYEIRARRLIRRWRSKLAVTDRWR